MAKYLPLLLLIALLVAAVSAHCPTHRTIITIEEDNPRGREQEQGQQQRCREQIQRQQLQQCSSYISQSSQSPYDIITSSSSSENQQQRRQQQQESLRECCQQLENLDEQCRCEAVREVVRQQQQHQQQQRQRQQQMREVVQRARDVTSQCNIGRQECQIRSILYQLEF